MNPFPHFPHPERFKTLEDAMAFLQKPDWRLCIPIFIQDGDRAKINPEYLNAPYEQRLVDQDGKLLNVLTKCQIT